MANSISKINGVTKKEWLQFFVYDFPLALITVDTNQNKYILQLKADFSNPQTVLFSDITDPLGASDVEGYVDELAMQGFFFDISSIENTEQSEDLGRINWNVTKSNINQNSAIDLLEDIRNLLIKIAE